MDNANPLETTTLDTRLDKGLATSPTARLDEPARLATPSRLDDGAALDKILHQIYAGLDKKRAGLDKNDATRLERVAIAVFAEPAVYVTRPRVMTRGLSLGRRERPCGLSALATNWAILRRRLCRR